MSYKEIDGSLRWKDEEETTGYIGLTLLRYNQLVESEKSLAAANKRVEELEAALEQIAKPMDVREGVAAYALKCNLIANQALVLSSPQPQEKQK